MTNETTSEHDSNDESLDNLHIYINGQIGRTNGTVRNGDRVLVWFNLSPYKQTQMEDLGYEAGSYRVALHFGERKRVILETVPPKGWAV